MGPVFRLFARIPFLRQLSILGVELIKQDTILFWMGPVFYVLLVREFLARGVNRIEKCFMISTFTVKFVFCTFVLGSQYRYNFANILRKTLHVYFQDNNGGGLCLQNR